MKKTFFTLFLIGTVMTWFLTRTNSNTHRNSYKKNQDHITAKDRNISRIKSQSKDSLQHYTFKENYPNVFIYRNGKLLKKLNLPGSDEVKNLSFEKIEETSSGFVLRFEWGGFPFSHQNDFKFNRDDELIQIKTMIWNNTSDSLVVDTTFSVRPPVPLKKWNVRKFYQKFISLL